ncbi:MAG: DMT family transporter [Thermoplasmata archaeon]
MATAGAACVTEEITVRTPDGVTLAAFALMSLLAGLNVVGVRFSNLELPPFWGAGLRFAVAAGISLVLALALRGQVPAGRAMAGAVLFGLLALGSFFAFVYWALVTVTAGLASVVLSLVPLVTIILAALLGLERLRWQALTGALVAVGGIAILFIGQLSLNVPLAPLLALVGGVFSFAAANVVAKRLPRIDPFWMNTIALGAGAAMLLLLSGAAGEVWKLPVSATTWIAFGYLVILGSVLLFVLFIFVVRRWTASGVSYQFVIMPVVAIVAGALLAGESITAALVLGAAVTISGVYFGALRRSSPGATAGRLTTRDTE